MKKMSNNSNGRIAGVANPSALAKGQGYREGSRNIYKAQAVASNTAASQPGFRLRPVFRAPATAIKTNTGFVHAIMGEFDTWFSGLLHQDSVA